MVSRGGASKGEPAFAALDTEELLAPQLAATPPTGLQSAVAACCCLQIKERGTVSEWMLSDNADVQPSLFQRLFMCQCGPQARIPSGMNNVPQLKGLMGVTLQSGEHNTAGSLQTLKWTRYDVATRTAEMKTFGGFSVFDGYAGSVGQWTEPVEASWCFLMNLARCGQFTYSFKFDEDFKRADIQISGNPLVVCCICIPCVPAWCSVPTSCVRFDMIASPGVEDGTSWRRRSSKCGGEMELSYKLLTVITEDGKKGPSYDKIEEAPEQMMITF